MTTKSRFNHPARKHFYKMLKQKFGGSRFTLLDVGVVSMVDYKRLHKEYDLNFQYIGIDLNKSIVVESMKYIKGDDTVHLWDIHDAHPPELQDYSFDVILVKHMLHYCKTYEVLNNLKPVLKDSGWVFVVNNRNIYTPKNVAKDNGKIVYSLGKYATTYSEKAYVKYLRKNFQVDHQSFGGKGKCKPYTVDILREK